MTGSPKSQRRTLLKAAGALTGIGVLGRLATAQNGTTNQTTSSTRMTETSTQTGTSNQTDGGTNQVNRRTIILGARVDHWLGLAPNIIEGSRNPTLGMIPTERYKIVWINLDGAEHEFQILGQKNGEEGQVLYQTGSSSERGATRSLVVKPTDRIRRYRCRFHPDRMQGDINRTGQFAGGTSRTFTTSGTNTNRRTGTTGRGFTTNGRFTSETTRGTFNTRTTGRTTNTRTTGGTFDTRTTGGTTNTRTTRTTRR